MFCRKCGKELSNDSKFCNSCGTAVDGEITTGAKSFLTQRRQTENADWKGKLMIIFSVFSAIGIVLPVITIKLFYRSNSYAVIDLVTAVGSDSEMSEMLAEVGLESTEFGMLMFFALAFAILALSFGIGILINKKRGVSENGLIPMAKATSQMGLVYAILMLIAVYYANDETKEYMMGMSVFSLSIWGWLQLIIPIINIFVLINGRVSKMNMQSVEDGNSSGEKICPKCGTRFMFGNQCPECGGLKVEKRICKMCGTQYEKGVQCPECGSTLIEK